MSFIERFKGRTSHVGKEGIHDVLLSTSESSQIDKNGPEPFSSMLNNKRQSAPNDSRVSAAVRRNRQDRESEMRRNASNMMMPQNSVSNEQQQQQKLSANASQLGNSRFSQYGIGIAEGGSRGGVANVPPAQQDKARNSHVFDRQTIPRSLSERSVQAFDQRRQKQYFEETPTNVRLDRQAQGAHHNAKVPSVSLQRNKSFNNFGIGMDQSHGNTPSSNDSTVSPPSYYSHQPPGFASQGLIPEMEWTPKVKYNTGNFTVKRQNTNQMRASIDAIGVARAHGHGQQIVPPSPSHQGAVTPMYQRLSEQQQRSLNEIRSKMDYYNGNRKYDVLGTPSFQQAGQYTIEMLAGRRQVPVSGALSPSASFLQYAFDQRSTGNKLFEKRPEGGGVAQRDAPGGGFRFRDLEDNYSAIHRSAKMILQKEASQNQQPAQMI